MDNFNGKGFVVIGTSRSHGAIEGPDNLNLRWPKLVASELNGIEINLAVSGSTLLGTGGSYAFPKENIPQYNPEIHAKMYVEYGTNELGIAGGNADVAAFGVVYKEFIRFGIEERDWKPHDIIIQNFYWPGCANVDKIPQYNQVFQETVDMYDVNYANYENKFRYDPYINDYFYNDRLHENVLGNRKIADWVKSIQLKSGEPQTETFKIFKQFRIV